MKLAEIAMELSQIINSETSALDLARLKELKKSARETEDLMKLDIIELSNKQFDAEWERDLAARALANRKFVMGIKKSR